MIAWNTLGSFLGIKPFECVAEQNLLHVGRAPQEQLCSRTAATMHTTCKRNLKRTSHRLALLVTAPPKSSFFLSTKQCRTMLRRSVSRGQELRQKLTPVQRTVPHSRCKCCKILLNPRLQLNLMQQKTHIVIHLTRGNSQKSWEKQAQSKHGVHSLCSTTPSRLFRRSLETSQLDKTRCEG